MPEDRVIRAAFWSDDRVRVLSSDSKIAFLWLIAVADRDGIAPVDYEAMRALLQEPPEQAIRVIDEEGLARPYVVGEDAWVWIPNLTKHQPSQGRMKPAPDESRPPPPPGDVQALLRTRLGRDPTTAECKRACPRAYGLKRRNPAGTPPTGAVASVWDCWCSFRKNPGNHTLDVESRKLIVKALKVTNVQSLKTFFRWAHESEAPGPRYWQGQNKQRRTYLGLSNLLNLEKLQNRFDEMDRWNASDEGEDVDTGFDPGVYGALSEEDAPYINPEITFVPRWRR